MSAEVFLTLGAILATHELQRHLRILFIGSAVALMLVVGQAEVP